MKFDYVIYVLQEELRTWLSWAEENKDLFTEKGEKYHKKHIAEIRRAIKKLEEA